MSLGNFTTEVANNAFVIASAYMVWQCWRWYRRHGNQWVYITFLVAMALLVASVGLRIGWWSAGLKYAPSGATYHPFFVEWKWIPSAISAIGYSSAVVLVVGFIEKITHRDMLCHAAMIVIAALILGVL